LPIFYPGVAVIGPRIVFSPRVYVGFGVFGWSAFNWHDRNVAFVNIDRTKRFNRQVNVYKGVEHSPWRPDRERRFVREQRAREIPRYRPVVRTLAPVPARRSGSKIVVPPKSDLSRERKPFLERDKVEKREQPDRKIEPRNKNVQVQPPSQFQPRPEKKPLDRTIKSRDRNVEVKPPAQIQPFPERRPLDRKIELRDRNVGVKPPAQIQPRPERKSLDRKIEPRDRNIEVKPPVQAKTIPGKKGVIERDKGEKERGEGDRESERGKGGGREGRR